MRKSLSTASSIYLSCMRERVCEREKERERVCERERKREKERECV